MAPRVEVPGEGPGTAAFWEVVRIFHGRVSRIDFQRVLNELIRGGRLADARLLAEQYDREESTSQSPGVHGGFVAQFVDRAPVPPWRPPGSPPRPPARCPDEANHHAPPPPPQVEPPAIDWREEG